MGWIINYHTCIPSSTCCVTTTGLDISFFDDLNILTPSHILVLLTQQGWPWAYNAND